MEIKKIGVAGTVESSDINVVIKAMDEPGIDIDLQSSVLKQFGNQIRRVIEETIEAAGVDGVSVKAIDKGALDFVIRARTMAALHRAADVKEYKWEE